MAWTKRRDAAVSSLKSLRTLPLVSIASVRSRGISDWRSNRAICCGRPSSNKAKSSRVSPPTIAPLLSVTLTKTFTSLTSTCRVGVCAVANNGDMANRVQWHTCFPRSQNSDLGHLAFRHHLLASCANDGVPTRRAEKRITPRLRCLWQCRPETVHPEPTSHHRQRFPSSRWEQSA